MQHVVHTMFTTTKTNNESRGKTSSLHTRLVLVKGKVDRVGGDIKIDHWVEPDRSPPPSKIYMN